MSRSSQRTERASRNNRVHSTLDRRVIGWFIAGILAAAFVQFAQVRAIGGGIEGLLSVGETSEMRPLVESELGPVPTVSGRGHDGQTAYVIARDPLGQGIAPDVLDHAGFRYRRILFPALGGGFGTFGPHATVFGLAVIGVIGFGLAVAATTDLALSYGASDRVALAALLTPGLWLAVRLLTVDALAVGLLLVALALWRRNRVPAAVMVLSAATLTKEQMLIGAAAMAVVAFRSGRRREGAALIVAPLACLIAWSAIVETLVGGGFSTRGNISLPFVGIARSIPVWPSTSGTDLVLLAIMVLALVISAGVAWRCRTSLMGAMLAAWVGLATVSSHWVWELGNNVARVFATVIPLCAIGIGIIASERRRPSIGAPP